MTDKIVWFVTGAGRGMGVDIVKAALAAGYAVVATGRNRDAVAKVLGEADDLLLGGGGHGTLLSLAQRIAALRDSGG